MGTVVVEMRSIRHPRAPKTVGVRVNLIYSTYKIELGIKQDESDLRGHGSRIRAANPGLHGKLGNPVLSDYPVRGVEKGNRELIKRRPPSQGSRRGAPRKGIVKRRVTKNFAMPSGAFENIAKRLTNRWSTVAFFPKECVASLQPTKPTDSMNSYLANFSFVFLSARSPGAKKQPNVVIMFMDDMGYADIGPFGAKDLPYPALGPDGQGG